MPRERDAQRKWPRRPPTTGIRLPEELVVKAKHRAIDERTTMGKLIEKALRAYLSGHN